MMSDDLWLTLMGPDDQGFWYLTDSTGRDFQIVGKPEDICGAAALFGWLGSSAGVSDEGQIEDARDFLMEHVGEEIAVSLHMAEHFRR